MRRVMEDCAPEQAENNGKIYRDNNGKFLRGNPGRPVGSVNETRKAIKTFLSDQSVNLPKWFDGLESDRERLEYFIRLCPYGVPRLQSVTFEAEEEKASSRIAWGKLKPETIKDILSSYEGI